MGLDEVCLLPSHSSEQERQTRLHAVSIQPWGKPKKISVLSLFTVPSGSPLGEKEKVLRLYPGKVDVGTEGTRPFQPIFPLRFPKGIPKISRNKGSRL